ncbi:hypothetical protein M405DRAFT_835474 [Rhizopogon salebrosus TDB-379]|nr:hypothetical protein M405DRAFT_835474 [Rhizopogon salebrosus TDB-379]
MSFQAQSSTGGPSEASSDVHQRPAHGSFTSRPEFEKIPGFKTPVDPLDISSVSVCPQHGYQCPDKIPFGYRPIYERIPEAELPTDPLGYSAVDPVGYRRIKYPPVKPDEARPAPDAVPVWKSKVEKILSRAREIFFNPFNGCGCAHRKPQTVKPTSDKARA